MIASFVAGFLSTISFHSSMSIEGLYLKFYFGILHRMNIEWLNGPAGNQEFASLCSSRK